MKGKLLSSVAAVAFGLGMVATGPALAGDVTDWDWYQNKYQEVDIKTWIWSFFDPSGVTEVKEFQIFAGDVVASAILGGDYLGDNNNGPSSHGHHNYNSPVYATDGLGHAVQDVTAVGIAASIESEFPVYANQTQVLFGGLFEKSEISAKAKAGIWFAPVEIAVDQNVAAVAEVLSITLEANEAPELIQTANEDHHDSDLDTGDTIGGGHHSHDYGVFMPYATNNILEADIVQAAYADVTASAVAFQDLSGLKNLGQYTDLGKTGLVANQSVYAAGLVSSVVNKVKAVTP